MSALVVMFFVFNATITATLKGGYDCSIKSDKAEWQ